VGDLKGAGRTRFPFKRKPSYNLERLANWHAILNEAKERKSAMLAELTKSSGIPMSPYRMLGEIRNFLPRDTICVLDGNVCMAAAQQVLPATYLPPFTAGTNGVWASRPLPSAQTHRAGPSRRGVAVILRSAAQWRKRR
jgi:glyoxylate carboligase